MAKTIPWSLNAVIADWNLWAKGLGDDDYTKLNSFTVSQAANRSADYCVSIVVPTNPSFQARFLVDPATVSYWNLTGTITAWFADTPGGDPLNGYQTTINQTLGGEARFFVDSGQTDWPVGGPPKLVAGTTYYLCLQATTILKGNQSTSYATFDLEVAGSKPAYSEVPPEPPPEPPTEPPSPPPTTGGPNNPPDVDPDDGGAGVTDPDIAEAVKTRNQPKPSQVAVGNTVRDNASKRITKNVVPEISSGIPEPRADADALYKTVAALKIQFEQLTRQRGDKKKSSLLVEELDEVVEAIVWELDKRYADQFVETEIPTYTGTTIISTAGEIVDALSAHISNTAVHISDAPSTGVWARRRGTWIRSVTFQDLNDAIAGVEVPEVVGVTSLEEDTAPALGGYLDLNGQGFKANFRAQVGLTAGELCYLDTNGNMAKADASQEATCKTTLAIALENIAPSTVGSFLLQGYYPAGGFTAGDVIYASETIGQMTNAPPVAGTTGAVVRVLGTVLTAGEIFFNPDRTWFVLS